jgi:hypothetical protein
VTDRLLGAAAVGVLALGLGACGGAGSSSHTSTTAQVEAPSTPVATTSATGVASTSAVARTTPSRSHATASTAGSAVGTPTAGRTTTAPPPAPAGTPTAPDGLRQTTGYATYELCASGCSGAVPPSLRRPLHLPQLSPGATCPVSQPSGPVAPGGTGPLRIESFIASSWSGGRVTWTASPSYGGPVLIRGRQLGGSGAVGFGEGHVPYDELQLLSSGQGSPGGRGRAWLTIIRVQGPGCYAYQVDGTGFSEVIVFSAAL